MIRYFETQIPGSMKLGIIKFEKKKKKALDMSQIWAQTIIPFQTGYYLVKYDPCTVF